jgi:hypothetical protein
MHVLLTLFPGNGADIPGFIAISGAPEVGMTHVQISFGATDGIGNQPMEFGRQRNPFQSCRSQMQQKPLGRQMNRQGWYDPVRIAALSEVFFKKFYAI